MFWVLKCENLSLEVEFQLVTSTNKPEQIREILTFCSYEAP